MTPRADTGPGSTAAPCDPVETHWPTPSPSDHMTHTLWKHTIVTRQMAVDQEAGGRHRQHHQQIRRIQVVEGLDVAAYGVKAARLLGAPRSRSNPVAPMA